MISRLSCWGFAIYLSLSIAQAAQENEITEFILENRVKTFDCPSAASIAKINNYLGLELGHKLRSMLSVERSHGLICEGKYQEADALLDSILASEESDQTSYYYASSVYQKGFIFDVQEDQRRCDYYQQAFSLALNKFYDVALSAELGLMTYCAEDVSEGKKLARLYSLLESYSQGGDNAIIAHIHNQIGLLFGRIGQHVLAAEQFAKTHELGLTEYTGANKYSSLISYFTSLLASAQLDEAFKVIQELDEAREEVDVSLVHAWYFYAKGRYYQHTQDYAALKSTLNEWQPYLNQMPGSIYHGFGRWFRTEVCISENDLSCIREFIQGEEADSLSSLRFMRGNVDYLSLLARASMALGDSERAEKYLAQYMQQNRLRMTNNQASGKVLGVANLYDQIDTLETRLERVQATKQTLLFGSLIVILFSIAFSFYFYRKKQRHAKSIDSVTQLLNSQAAQAKIKKLPSPTLAKVNALALFDLANFKEVNRLVGSANADETLQQIAAAFKKETRESDILGRFAPEQFLLCLGDIEENDAKAFFQRIQLALKDVELSKVKGRKVRVSSSMSIYIATDAFDDLDSVLDDMVLSLNIKSEPAKNT